MIVREDLSSEKGSTGITDHASVITVVGSFATDVAGLEESHLTPTLNVVVGSHDSSHNQNENKVLNYKKPSSSASSAEKCDKFVDNELKEHTREGNASSIFKRSPKVVFCCLWFTQLPCDSILSALQTRILVIRAGYFASKDNFGMKLFPVS
jgi:hypothetical protein